jgi:uncharacterized protein YcfL
MTRPTFVLFLALLAAACSSSRNRPTRTGYDAEGKSPVVVHPEIDREVRGVKHDVGRTSDGRLRILVVLENRDRRDIALIARTTWMDAAGSAIEQGPERSVLIPSGGTVLYEDVSFSREAVRFNVALRPASTDRKR